MATFQFSARRLIFAGGFAVAAAAAPVVAVIATPAQATFAPLAQACPTGEEEDLYTGVCVPHTVPNSGPVPNSGGSFSPIPGNPDLPSVDGIPCTGANTGQCIGLSEENQAMGPAAPPQVTFGDGRNA